MRFLLLARDVRLDVRVLTHLCKKSGQQAIDKLDTGRTTVELLEHPVCDRFSEEK